MYTNSNHFSYFDYNPNQSIPAQTSPPVVSVSPDIKNIPGTRGMAHDRGDVEFKDECDISVLRFKIGKEIESINKRQNQLEMELKDKERENEYLKREIASREAKLSEKDAVISQLKRAQANVEYERSEIYDKLDTIHQYYDALKNTLMGFESRTVSLKEMNKVFLSEKQEMESKYEDLLKLVNGKIEAWAAEKKKYFADKKIKQNKIEALTLEIQNLQNEVSNNEKFVNELKKDLEFKDGQVQGLTSELSKKFETNSKLNLSVQELENKIQTINFELEEENHKLKEAERNFEILKKEYSKMEVELQETREKLEYTSSELLSWKNESMKLDEKLQQSLSLITELNRDKTMYEEKEIRMEQSIKTFEDTISQLNITNETLSKTTVELQQSLNEKEKELELNENEITRLTDMANELTLLADNSNKSFNQEKENLLNKENEAKEEAGKLKGELVLVKQEKQRIKDEYDKLSIEVSKLRKDLESLQNKIQKYSTDLDKSTFECAELQLENTKLNDELSAEKEKTLETKSKFDTLIERQSKEYQKKMQDKDKKIKEMEEQMSELEIEKDKTFVSLKMSEKQNKDLSHRLEKVSTRVTKALRCVPKKDDVSKEDSSRLPKSSTPKENSKAVKISIPDVSSSQVSKIGEKRKTLAKMDMTNVSKDIYDFDVEEDDKQKKKIKIFEKSRKTYGKSSQEGRPSRGTRVLQGLPKAKEDDSLSWFDKIR